MNKPSQSNTFHGPFDLTTDQAYRRWRDAKQRALPLDVDALKVEIERPEHLQPQEREALLTRIRAVNTAIYSIKVGNADKAQVAALGRQLGLHRLDGNLCSDEDNITSLQVVDSGRHTTYIPYSNRPLSWHTDGYYNPSDKQIRAIVMHCAQPAAEGGENQLLDHEWAYIHLRDQEPAYISALMHPQAMTIPPNTAEGEELRGAQSGPVFSVMPDNQSLHMRYSARTRNIQWREDAATQEAVACLNEFLQGDSPCIYRYRLAAGEGVISNNVLHNRTGFKDETAGQQRLLYRARYYDRVQDTGLAMFFD